MTEHFHGFFLSCLAPHPGGRLPLRTVKAEWNVWTVCRYPKMLRRTTVGRLGTLLEAEGVKVVDDVCYDVALCDPKTVAGRRFAARLQYDDKRATDAAAKAAFLDGYASEQKALVMEFFAERYETGVPFQVRRTVVRMDWGLFVGIHPRAKWVTPQAFNRVATGLGIAHDTNWYYFLRRRPL